MSRASLAALGIVWAAAAGGEQPASLAVTPERIEAAGYAVTHGTLVANLARNCARFRGRLAQDPEQALAEWRQRNAERAAAAEAYLVYAHAAIERQEGAAAAEDFNRRTRALFRRKANEALNDIFERASPQVWTCEHWIAAIAQGKADLDGEPKYRARLEELVGFERSVRQGGATR